jgi:hypothetical protein
VRIYDFKGTQLAEPLDAIRPAGSYNLALPESRFKGGYAILDFRAGSVQQTIPLSPH